MPLGVDDYFDVPMHLFWIWHKDSKRIILRKKNKIWDTWLYNNLSAPQLGLSYDFENPLKILYLIWCSYFF